MSSSRRALLLGGLGLLSACGDLPQPYRGQPGALAERLARPPAYRLAVPAPSAALLPNAEAEAYARALTEALVAAEVPAVTGDERLPLDWVVETTAAREGRNVVPRYVLRDVALTPGTFIIVEGTPDGEETAALDYVELRKR